MTVQEKKARYMLRQQTTKNLLTQWELTSIMNDPYIPTVRGWIMDEIERRFPEQFNDWLSNDNALDDSTLKDYIKGE